MTRLANKPVNKQQLTTRFLSVALVLVFMGGFTMYNTSGMLSSFVRSGMEDDYHHASLVANDKKEAQGSIKTESLLHYNRTNISISSPQVREGVSVSLKSGSSRIKADTIQLTRPNVTASSNNNATTTSNKTRNVRIPTKQSHPVIGNETRAAIEKLRARHERQRSLPRALQPVKFRQCCDRGHYETTCLTEYACGNKTLYPFSSVQQRKMLQTYNFTLVERRKLFRECNAAKKAAPPRSWCSVSNSVYPMGCSHFSMSGGSGPYDRLLLYPSHRLAFCGIPKNGISQWLQFLRFTLGAKDYQSEPYYKLDVLPFYLDKLHPNVQQQIWNSKNTTRYTRAIFIREPAERLLSAYLDKVETHNLKSTRTPPFGWNVTFAEFVDILSMNNVTQLIEKGCFTGVSWMTDPHWRPQAYSCGLYNDLENFDYIGGLDQAAHHTKTLLNQVGLWDSFGKHYRTEPSKTKKGHRYVTWPPEPPFNKTLGFQQHTTKKIDRHARGSKQKLEQYYTPQLMAKVKRLYRMDFQLWDAIQTANKQGLVHGKDIARILNKRICG